MKCVLKYMKEGSAKLILVYGELFSQSWQMIGTHTHTHTTQFWALGMMCGTLLLKTHQNIPVTPSKRTVRSHLPATLQQNQSNKLSPNHATVESE